GRVDPALGGDRVCSPRAILVAEAGYLVAQFRQRGGRRAARQARSDDDDGILPLVRRVDQLHVKLVIRPLLLDRARRYVRLEFHGALLIYRSRVNLNPVRTARGTLANPRVTRIVNMVANRRPRER